MDLELLIVYTAILYFLSLERCSREILVKLHFVALSKSEFWVYRYMVRITQVYINNLYVLSCKEDHYSSASLRNHWWVNKDSSVMKYKTHTWCYNVSKIDNNMSNATDHSFKQVTSFFSHLMNTMSIRFSHFEHMLL